MTRIFLKAKHWQLFLAMVGVPILFQFYFMSQFWDIESTPKPPVESDGFKEALNEQFIQFDLFPYVMLFFTFMLFGWLWSLGVGLQKMIPDEIRTKTKSFKFLLLVPALYIVFVLFLIGTIFNGMAQDGFANAAMVIAILIPLHLFSMFCIFYSIYFAAKTLKMAELQRKVGIGDYIGEFFMLWFYFVGIWFIQPRVNSLYERK